jgi:hypothetical protein
MSKQVAGGAAARETVETTHRTRIGQKTGMSKISNRVMQKAMTVPLTRENLKYVSEQMHGIKMQANISTK